MKTEYACPQIAIDHGLEQDFTRTRVNAAKIGKVMSKVGFYDDEIAETRIELLSDVPQELTPSTAYGDCSNKHIRIFVTRIALNRDDDETSSYLDYVLGHELGHRYDFARNRIGKTETIGESVIKGALKAGAVAVGTLIGYRFTQASELIQFAGSGLGYLAPEVQTAKISKTTYDDLNSHNPNKKPSIFEMPYLREMEKEDIRKFYQTNADERSADGFARAARVLLQGSIKVKRTKEQIAAHRELYYQRQPLDMWDVMSHFISVNYAVNSRLGSAK